MKVSRKSWHYRAYKVQRAFWNEPLEAIEKYLLRKDRQLKDYQPRNLCRYFWGVVLGWAFMPLLFVFTAVVAFALGLILLLAIVAEGFCRVWRRIRRREAPAEGGLLRSYVRARKQRVCPLIELEDELPLSVLIVATTRQQAEFVARARDLAPGRWRWAQHPVDFQGVRAWEVLVVRPFVDLGPLRFREFDDLLSLVDSLEKRDNRQVETVNMDALREEQSRSQEEPNGKHQPRRDRREPDPRP